LNLPELFIRRPVMTTLVMSGILLFGAVSYRFLPVSDLPNVDYPRSSLRQPPRRQSRDDGFRVATPLERQLTTIAGIDSMSSVSAQGLSQITIQFHSSAASTPRRKTCSRLFPKRRGNCHPACPHRPLSTSQSG